MFKLKNKGYAVEDVMRKWYRGIESGLDEVDFETKKFVYEVKSCKLFNTCINSNHYRSKTKKICHTVRHGRFFIQLDNHQRIKATAVQKGKIPRYLFVVVLGKQYFRKSLSWEAVDALMKKDKENTLIHIRQVWGIEINE